MPGAVDEPVLVVGGYDVGGVDSVVVVEAAPLGGVEVGGGELVVGGGAGHEAEVLPCAAIGVGGFAYAD